MRADLLGIAAILLLSLGCASTPVVGRTAEGAEIVQIPLRLSNVYLIKSRAPILVDSGTYGDMRDLERALTENGVRLRDIRLVVVTHAHADHAGLAADLHQLTGAKIVLGAGDVTQAATGKNDDLKPTSFIARVAKPTIPSNFPEFAPDLPVSEPLALAPWGVDGRVVQMPGHTPGSVVLILANHTAFVGDEMLGGWYGGAFFPKSPGEHYYQADPVQNWQNIATLVHQGIETFYLGHGGPVSRADVIAAFGL